MRDTGHQINLLYKIEKSVKIANLKNLKSDGWRVVWVFDHIL